jgi:hypothetical protein
MFFASKWLYFLALLRKKLRRSRGTTDYAVLREDTADPREPGATGLI